MMRNPLFGLLLCAAICAPAAQAEEIPDGWYLHDELSPSLDLVYYDAAARDTELTLHCDAGYPDLVVAFYPDAAMPDGAYALVLQNGAVAETVQANGAVFNDRFVIDGLTRMSQPVATLLLGDFSVAVDGVEIKSFGASDGTKNHVQRFIDACLPG